MLTIPLTGAAARPSDCSRADTRHKTPARSWLCSRKSVHGLLGYPVDYLIPLESPLSADSKGREL